MVTGAIDINLGPVFCRITDPAMALDNSPGPDDTVAPGDSESYSDQHVPGGCIAVRPPCDHKLWSRPWASLWSLAATWTMAINTDPGQSRSMDTDTALGSSLDQNVSIAPDGSAGHPDRHGPSGSMTLRYLQGSQEVTQITGPCTAPSDRHHKHLHMSSWLLQGSTPRPGPWS